jgi:transposase
VAISVGTRVTCPTPDGPWWNPPCPPGARPAQRALAFGRPPEHELRDLLDAILYVDRTGIPWRYLPHDYPPWETIYAYSAAEGRCLRATQRPVTAVGPRRHVAMINLTTRRLTGETTPTWRGT